MNSPGTRIGRDVFAGDHRHEFIAAFFTRHKRMLDLKRRFILVWRLTKSFTFCSAQNFITICIQPITLSRVIYEVCSQQKNFVRFFQQYQ